MASRKAAQLELAATEFYMLMEQRSQSLAPPPPQSALIAPPHGAAPPANGGAADAVVAPDGGATESRADGVAADGARQPVPPSMPPAAAPALPSDSQIRRAAVALRKARYELGLDHLSLLGRKVTLTLVLAAMAGAGISLWMFHEGADDRVAEQNAATCEKPDAGSIAGSTTTTPSAPAGGEGDEEQPCAFDGGGASKAAVVGGVAASLALLVLALSSRPAPAAPGAGARVDGGAAHVVPASGKTPRWGGYPAFLVGGVGGAALLIWSCFELFDKAVAQDVSATFAARTLATTIGALLTAGILGILAAHRHHEGGLLAYVVGADNRLSTSYTQSALWTIAIVVAALIICFNRLLQEQSFDDILGNFDSTYLLLLGGPFAAVVAAKAITTNKDGTTIQKTSGADPGPRDIIADDDGRADLVDAQFLAFNLVALVVFVISFANDVTDLPKLPAALAGLTTVSGLAYLGHKATLHNMPQISSIVGVERGAVSAGSRIVISGSNFVPAGAKDPELLSDMRVSFDAVSTPVSWGGESDNALDDPRAGGRLVVTVPAGVEPKSADSTVLVTVTTSAGVMSDPYPLKMASTAPYIRALVPPVLTPGQTGVKIHGAFFGGAEAFPTVQIGDLRVQPYAAGASDVELTFDVPATLPVQPASVPVVVSTMIGSSAAVTVPVARSAAPMPD